MSTKEQSLLTKIASSFEGKSMQIQYSVFGFSIDLNSHGYKVIIKSGESVHCNRDNGYEKERLKVIENKLCPGFNTINPEKENFTIHKSTNEIFSHIKKLSKEILDNKISNKSLGLEFKSENDIKPEVMKFITNKILPDYK